jgi:MFS family permease
MTRRVALGCSATFAGAFDFGFMTLAAPALDRELGLGAAYGWIFSAGSLAYGASVMPAAGLAGRVAPPRLLATGLLLAASGAALVACAPGAAAALVGRALFGLGGGIAATPALALLAAIEPPAARRAAFARLGAAVTLGFTTGALLAALVPAWRAVLLAFAAALTALAATAHNPRPTSERGQTPLWGLGAARGAWWFGGATVGVTVALGVGAVAPGAAGVVGAGALGMARTGWRRAGWLPAARAATLALCAAGAATTASGVGAIVLVGRALSDADGVVLAAFGAAVPLAAVLARRAAAEVGAAGSAGIGLAVQAGGIAAIALAIDAPLALAAPLVAFGAGHAMANAGTADALTALAGVQAPRVGGLLVTTQFAGAGAGAVLAVGVADAAGQAVALALAAAIAAGGAAILLPLRAAPAKVSRS